MDDERWLGSVPEEKVRLMALSGSNVAEQYAAYLEEPSIEAACLLAANASVAPFLQMELFKISSRKVDKVLAANPHTVQQILKDLWWRSVDEQASSLWRALAGNHSTPPSVLARLPRSRNVDLALARNSSVPAGLCWSLSGHSDGEVRARLAANPGCDIEVVYHLAQYDAEDQVRLAAVMNPRADKGLWVERSQSDPSSVVADYCNHRLSLA